MLKSPAKIKKKLNLPTNLCYTVHKKVKVASIHKAQLYSKYLSFVSIVQNHFTVGEFVLYWGQILHRPYKNVMISKKGPLHQQNQ